MVKMYLDGGVFMHPILGFLILGVGIVIYKLWSLFMASINTKNFIIQIRSALKESGIDGAIDVCAHTRGPVAAIFHAGLLRSNRGLEYVEKAIINAGTIEMAFLERGFIWLTSCTSLAPLLGFLGTVSGMIHAFEAIAAANDISPSIVASGIAEALITTLFGLVVAIIIQSAQNFLISRVDKLVIDMEEGAAELIDSLVELEKAGQVK